MPANRPRKKQAPFHVTKPERETTASRDGAFADMTECFICRDRMRNTGRFTRRRAKMNAYRWREKDSLRPRRPE